ncbi:hypothetical protein GOODEAATRI_015054, partial [Goodea atripinnis]
EQPIFSSRAHVFQIDPNTKKNWVPTSKHAVTVSYFFDSTRNVYRIIKHQSQLLLLFQFAEKFAEFKEAARLAKERSQEKTELTSTPSQLLTSASRSVSSSSSINKHWEAELEALKGNNAKLTAALLESTANVKQWKQQLGAYQEEAERLHKRVRLCR